MSLVRDVKIKFEMEMPFADIQGSSDIEHTIRYIFSGIQSEYNIKNEKLTFVDEDKEILIRLHEKNEVCGCDWCMEYYNMLTKIRLAE